MTVESVESRQPGWCETEWPGFGGEVGVDAGLCSDAPRMVQKRGTGDDGQVS